MKIYFLEYKEAFGKVDGSLCLEVLRIATLLKEIAELGVQGINDLWHAKLIGRGYNRAVTIVNYAETSIGLRDGAS